MPFFNNHSDDHLIVLLQLCRAKTVDNEVRISSSYTATKVLFNLDCQEFADFRNSLKANCSPLRSISVVSYGHSANNSQSPMVVSTIRDLYERAEESESGDEAISPIVQANLKLKGVANDQDEVDTGAIKRCLLDQFSSSQNLKKCRALVIKEEKTL
nr:replication factor A protein 1-like isoform X2 [Ipomoea batatas]GMD49261.1 replication factor A protein 1-like isoform X2 [Ipomoea batatas]